MSPIPFINDGVVSYPFEPGTLLKYKDIVVEVVKYRSDLLSHEVKIGDYHFYIGDAKMLSGEVFVVEKK